MVFYQPFLEKHKKRQVKKNRFRLLALLFLFIVISSYFTFFSKFYSSIPLALLIRGDQNFTLIQEEPSPAESIFSQSFPSASNIPDENSQILAKTPPPRSNFRIIEGVLQKGDNLYNFLVKKRVKKETIHTIVQHLKPLFPFASAMPGDSFALTLDLQENLHRFEYKLGPIETYILERDPNGRVGSFKKDVALEKYWIVISGKVKDSLFNSIGALSEDNSLAPKFADIFAWRIDFLNEPREGDKFRLVVEKYCLDSTFIKYGRILAAEYNGHCGLHQAIYYEDEDGRGDYYDLNGISLRRAFLKAPVRFNHISSGYSYHRRHPILGYVRPHLGIDYAAPSGTSVWAVADGTIVSAGYEGGNGNQVIIRHMNGYQTYYNHLLRFGKGIRSGARVSQKQVIGYVGTTGLSTGPHLDYRVKHHGNFINPLKESFPTGQKLEPSCKTEFHKSAYALLKFMYDSRQEKWICQVHQGLETGTY